MNTKKKIITCLILGLSLVSAATLGYMLLEDMNFLEAMYMTVMTMTTVGYREVKTPGPSGMILNMLVMLFGVGAMLYILGTFTQVMVEGQIRAILGRRKLVKRVAGLKDHYIVCGYGRMGSPVCHEIKNKKRPLVVVEKSSDVVEKLDAEGFLYIIGDATEEHVLLEAGIERAKGLVTVLPTDVENVYVTLTARGLKSDLLILARASEPGSEKKLKRAGASKVVSPYYLSGRKMAQEILQPTITNFFELVFQERGESIDLQMEEIKVGKNAHIVNTTLQDSRIRQDFNLIVVAIKKKNGEMLYNPTYESKIEVEDTLIALGPGPDLERLAAKLDAQP
jgi:voltage-gated potassium channel